MTVLFCVFFLVLLLGFLGGLFGGVGSGGRVGGIWGVYICTGGKERRNEGRVGPWRRWQSTKQSLVADLVLLLLCCWCCCCLSKKRQKRCVFSFCLFFRGRLSLIRLSKYNRMPGVFLIGWVAASQMVEENTLMWSLEEQAVQNPGTAHPHFSIFGSRRPVPPPLLQLLDAMTAKLHPPMPITCMPTHTRTHCRFFHPPRSSGGSRPLCFCETVGLVAALHTIQNPTTTTATSLSLSLLCVSCPYLPASHTHRKMHAHRRCYASLPTNH